MATTTPTPTVDSLDIRDELVRLAENDSEGFCRLLYAIGDDLMGARFRKGAGPYARAALEGGRAMSDVALRYARVADDLADDMAEAATSPAPAALAAA